ncbi:MAG: hypothetical protein AABW89_00110 [Nanoarchaeota archaeon]
MKIYLVHPGENDSSELTSRGVWQMQALARRLIMDNIDADRIYANGHEVSIQSGNVLSKCLRIPVINDERFVEINKKVIFGEINKEDVENFNYLSLFVEEIVGKGKDAIITMGGGIHRAVISLLTGMHLHETRHFSLLPASISVLHYIQNEGPGAWRVSLVNDRSHLNLP